MLIIYKNGENIAKPKSHNKTPVEVEMMKNPTLYGTRTEDETEGLSAQTESLSKE